MIINIIKYLVRVIVNILTYIIGSLFFPASKGQIPPIKDPIILLSASEISKQIKDGKLKAVDVLRAYSKRVEEVNPFINAVIEIRKDAYEDAMKIDERIENEKKGIHQDNISIKDLPLLGVPVTCKDSISIKGMHLVIGLADRKNTLSLSDASVITNIKNAGGIPFAITNVPELVWWFDTYNTVFGRTKNPYDLSRITGGSSGGESAIISSGSSVIGIGSDIGGSIRIPSSCCGIFGHFTTRGIIPEDGTYPSHSPEKCKLFAIGPMTRHSCDIIPFLKAMAGENISKLPNIDKSVDLSKLKYFYMEGLDLWTPVDKEIKSALHKAIDHLEEKFDIKFSKVNLKLFNQVFFLALATFEEVKDVPFSVEMTNRKGDINLFFEVIKWMLGLSHHTFAAIFLAFQEKIRPSSKSVFMQNLLKKRDQLKSEIQELLGENGIFLFPSFPQVAIKHLTTFLKLDFPLYSAIFNLVGLPVTCCPIQLNSEGLPICLQIAASPFQDQNSIAVAIEFEKRFGGWVPPCQISL